MVLTIGSELEAALKQVAREQGVAPEILALTVLQERFLAPPLPIKPQDEWERRLIGAARDWGVSLPDSAPLSSEGLYE